MRSLYVLAALLLTVVPAAAQSPSALPFSLELVEVEVAEMPGLHSFAWAEHDGKWLFVTGRVDGLHPIATQGNPEAFPPETANDAVWVVDLAAGQVWSRALDELPDAVADPLRVTNAQYHQTGETLYVVGGYGTVTATGEKITFPTLTALDVPGLIGAVTGGDALAPHIRQTEAEFLAVTGGEMRPFMGYALIGGHRFDGEYTHPPTGFTQQYTERILLFDIEDDGAALDVAEHFALESQDESRTLHRRDLTVAPSFYRYLPVDAEHPHDYAIGEGWGLYGGVFRLDVDLPFRTPIHLGFSDTPEFWERSFEQQFGLYTAPTLPLWDAPDTTMHTVFFGGMSEFYYDEEAGEVVRDPLVPFTDDIATLTSRLRGSGTMVETVMPLQMPGLLGTNAAMIPAPGVPRTDLGIVRLREVEGRTLVGHIVGGIVSETLHPGWYGAAEAETGASDHVFAVYLTPRFGSAAEPGAAPAAVAFEPVYPNPFRTEATVAFVLDRPADVAVEVYDVMGRRVAVLHEGPLGAQRHAFAFRPGALPAGVYTVRVHGGGVHATRSVVRVR